MMVPITIYLARGSWSKMTRKYFPGLREIPGNIVKHNIVISHGGSLLETQIRSHL